MRKRDLRIDRQRLVGNKKGVSRRGRGMREGSGGEVITQCIVFRCDPVN